MPGTSSMLHSISCFLSLGLAWSPGTFCLGGRFLVLAPNIGLVLSIPTWDQSQLAELRPASCLLLPYLAQCQPPPGRLPASSGQADYSLCWSWRASPGDHGLTTPLPLGHPTEPGVPWVPTPNLPLAFPMAWSLVKLQFSIFFFSKLQFWTPHPTSHSWTAPTCHKPLPRKCPHENPITHATIGSYQGGERRVRKTERNMDRDKEAFKRRMNIWTSFPTSLLFLMAPGKK